jgi:purine nucleoside phosphorylase
MFQTIGADAVGMSTVPEAMFANALGMKVAALSCVCNRAAGLGDERLTAEDVMRVAAGAMPRMRDVMELFIKEIL